MVTEAGFGVRETWVGILALMILGRWIDICEPQFPHQLNENHNYSPLIRFNETGHVNWLVQCLALSRGCINQDLFS